MQQGRKGIRANYMFNLPWTAQPATNLWQALVFSRRNFSWPRPPLGRIPFSGNIVLVTWDAWYIHHVSPVISPLHMRMGRREFSWRMPTQKPKDSLWTISRVPLSNWQLRPCSQMDRTFVYRFSSFLRIGKRMDGWSRDGGQQIDDPNIVSHFRTIYNPR